MNDLGLNPAEMAALRSLLSQATGAVAPVAPVKVVSPESLADVKANLQEIGDRLVQSWDRLRIPIKVLQRDGTSDRLAGRYYVEQFSLEDFVGFLNEYYASYPNSEPHQHVSALINTVIFLRDEHHRNRDLLLLAMDHYALLQERLVHEAVARELQAWRSERQAQVTAQVLPPVPGSANPRARVNLAVVESVDVDLVSDAPAPDMSKLGEIIEEEDGPTRKKQQRETVTDDEDLEEDTGDEDQ